jgi:hypothetical protein
LGRKKICLLHKVNIVYYKIPFSILVSFSFCFSYFSLSFFIHVSLFLFASLSFSLFVCLSVNCLSFSFYLACLMSHFKIL